MEKVEKFEEKITKLEQIVNELENGEIDLDNSINKYFEAMKLAKECDDKLKSIEDKITKMIADNGNLTNFEVI
ncbi:MAG: exodeoxyribonuclease VII small subunit [Bacilli bacterium]